MSIFDQPRPEASRFPDAVDADLKTPGASVEGKVVEVSPEIQGKHSPLLFIVLEQEDGSHVRVMAPIKTSARTGKKYGMGASFQRFGGAEGDLAGFKFEGMSKDGFRLEDVRVIKAKNESLFD